jgi:hypothetical protein
MIFVTINVPKSQQSVASGIVLATGAVSAVIINALSAVIISGSTRF